MFDYEEHEALMRLMTYATGYIDDSRRIAYWLQEWDQSANPRTIKDHVPGLDPDHSRDVKLLAQAARRTAAKPSTLDRPEYSYRMGFVERAHPLPGEFER